MPVEPRRWARAVAVVLGAAIAGSLIYSYFAHRLSPIPNRTFRMGWESNPPFQSRTETGYGGLAVEIVNEAAKRAGIRLQWVETGASSEESFQRGLVDMWPLMADLPERRKRIHFTSPWVVGTHVLLIRADSPTPDSSFTGRVALFRLPLHLRFVKGEFPQAQAVPLPGGRDVLTAVCRGDAGFLEKRVAMIAMKESPPACAIRLVNLPHLVYKIGLASTFESAPAADAIRQAIGSLFRDGTVAQTIARYSYYGLDDNWATYDLLEEAERGRWFAWTTGAVVVVVILALGQVVYLRLRKRSEKNLRDSEERFRAIFQQVGVGVAQIGLDGTVQIANDRYCEVVGRAQTDLVGTSTTEITHRADLKEEAAILPRLLAGEIPFFSTEKRYTRKDGSVVWANMCKTVVRDPSGTPQSIIAVVEDITQRKRAEANLRESEERFRNLADSAPVLIWMCGADKRCTFHNKGWLEFTGRTAAEALQDNWPDHIHPNDRERCYETYAAAFDAGRDYQFECRLRRADGEYRWFLNRGVARFVDGGAFAGYIGCSLEITELKRGYEQHLGTQKLESVGILAAGVAHEFNNALGAIAALAEAAQSDLPSGAPAAANLDGIQQTALRASQIASQLMTFTRHDQAPAAAVDLSALIAEMLDLLKVSISKSAVLATSLPPGLPLISANPSELRQMVMNLVINASDALEGKPGTISIAAAPVEHKGVEAVRLEVADTGRGMAPDTRERIFDPFFTTRSMGRGLGLFAVQGIVRRLGGAIEVQSSLNSGSRFVVLLPRHAGPAPQAWTNGASANGAVHTRPITVLFVDDEDSLRSSIARLLRKQNFQVIEAADGPSAIDVFNNSDRAGIDIILLDVTLPGMRGVDVLDGLRRLRPDVKVVLCTAYSEEIARVEFVNREIHGFIRKPYRAADLVKLLSRCVED